MRGKAMRGLAMALVLVVLTAVAAMADQVHGDDLATGGDTTLAPGATGSAYFYLQPTAGDGCNADASNPVTITLSSNAAWLTIDAPGTITLTACKVGSTYNGGSNGYSVSLSAPDDAVGTISGVATGGKAGNDGFKTDNASFTVTVDAGSANNAPVVSTAALDDTDTEGSTLTASGAFTDADGDPLTITADNIVGTFTDNGDGSWSWSYATTDNVSGTITVTADDGTDTATDSFNYTSTNVPPTVSAAFAAGAVDCGTDNASLVVGITDPGTDDTHSAVINWGDGSGAENIASIADGDAISHTYGSAGSYNATISVTDDDGGEGSDLVNALSVNYTLNGGGILAPVNQNGTSVFKHGSTVPVKIQALDCDGAAASGLTPSIKVHLGSAAAPSGDVNEYASTSNADTTGVMRWSDPQYIYNLATKTLPDPAATYWLDIKIGTQQVPLVKFGLKK